MHKFGLQHEYCQRCCGDLAAFGSAADSLLGIAIIEFFSTLSTLTSANAL
jgi:hypothetical protein